MPVSKEMGESCLALLPEATSCGPTEAHKYKNVAN